MPVARGTLRLIAEHLHVVQPDDGATGPSLGGYHAVKELGVMHQQQLACLEMSAGYEVDCMDHAIGTVVRESHAILERLPAESSLHEEAGESRRRVHLAGLGAEHDHLKHVLEDSLAHQEVEAAHGGRVDMILGVLVLQVCFKLLFLLYFVHLPELATEHLLVEILFVHRFGSSLTQQLGAG